MSSFKIDLSFNDYFVITSTPDVDDYWINVWSNDDEESLSFQLSKAQMLKLSNLLKQATNQ